MAFDRLKALGHYFDQLRSNERYQSLVEEQCGLIANELRGLPSLDLQDATALLALIQQSQHWTEAHKRTLLDVIHGKVEASMGGRAVQSRAPNQDYTYFPLYLTKSDWEQLVSTSVQFVSKLEAVASRLWSLGLRNPSEDTSAMLTGVLLLTEPHRMSDGLQLRSSYLSTKQLLKDWLKKRGAAENPPPVLMRSLPPTISALPQELRNDAYAGSEEPASLPPGITMERLKQLEGMVPNRSNSKILQIHLPKASGFPLACQPMAMGMGGNYMMHHGMGMYGQSQYSAIFPGLGFREVHSLF